MTGLVAYLLKRLTYATNSSICASESFFLKAGILLRPLLIELKRRSSVTSFCQAASVRSRAWTCFACKDFARPSLPWQELHFASNVALESPGTSMHAYAREA